MLIKLLVECSRGHAQSQTVTYAVNYRSPDAEARAIAILTRPHTLVHPNMQGAVAACCLVHPLSKVNVAAKLLGLYSPRYRHGVLYHDANTG